MTNLSLGVGGWGWREGVSVTNLENFAYIVISRAEINDDEAINNEDSQENNSATSTSIYVASHNPGIILPDDT